MTQPEKVVMTEDTDALMRELNELDWTELTPEQWSRYAGQLSRAVAHAQGSQVARDFGQVEIPLPEAVVAAMVAAPRRVRRGRRPLHQASFVAKITHIRRLSSPKCQHFGR